MPTNKNNNFIKKHTKNVINSNKIDELQGSTKEQKMARSSLKIGETPDVDQGINPDKR